MIVQKAEVSKGDSFFTEQSVGCSCFQVQLEYVEKAPSPRSLAGCEQCPGCKQDVFACSDADCERFIELLGRQN